jgi:hypothetical protein
MRKGSKKILTLDRFILGNYDGIHVMNVFVIPVACELDLKKAALCASRTISGCASQMTGAKFADIV